MDAEHMTIGRLASAVGTGVETIRYYQRRGLIEVPRAIGGYRSYGRSHVERLRFIRRAQSIGFSLEEITELLQLNDSRDHLRARALAAAKITDIEQRIAHLQSMATALRHLVCTCEDGGEDMPCPIIRMALEPEEPPATRS
jgi:MerR family mercuric resistance operon transcriptional regulator